MVEKMFSTSTVASLLDLHVNDVNRLINAGKLKAREIVVRGRGGRPRRRIPESELKRFQESLPFVQTKAFNEAGAPPLTSQPVRPRRRSSSARRGVMLGVRNYCVG